MSQYSSVSMYSQVSRNTNLLVGFSKVKLLIGPGKGCNYFGRPPRETLPGAKNMSSPPKKLEVEV